MMDWGWDSRFFKVMHWGGRLWWLWCCRCLRWDILRISCTELFFGIPGLARSKVGDSGVGVDVSLSQHKAGVFLLWKNAKKCLKQTKTHANSLEVRTTWWWIWQDQHTTCRKCARIRRTCGRTNKEHLNRNNFPVKSLWWFSLMGGAEYECYQWPWWWMRPTIVDQS